MRLIADGRTRWKIAELAGISEGETRETIRSLCERYDCRMESLPAAVNGGLTPEGGDSSERDSVPHHVRRG